MFLSLLHFRCATDLLTATKNCRIQRHNNMALDLCLHHLHSTPPFGDSRRNIVMTFGVEKLEWFGYQW